MLIHDGYDLDFEIQAMGPFDGIKGRYRPATPDEVNDWRLAARTSGRDETDARIKILDKKLRSWDLQETVEVCRKLIPEWAKTHCDGLEEGKKVSVPIIPATLRALPDRIFNAIFDVVTGYGPKVADPEKNGQGA